MNASVEVTQLLRAWGRGDPHAQDELLAHVYQELRRRAAAHLRRERPDHTLQATALVHEAYLRLLSQRVVWENRAHFFGVAAQIMRRILVDHARRHGSAKRPSTRRKVALDEHIGAVEPRADDYLALDRALRELAQRDQLKVRIVELRYFCGLSEQETATALFLSRATVTREWREARAWLRHRLTDPDPHPGCDAD